jgi:Fibronectin type III domain
VALLLRRLSRVRPSGLLLSGLFIGALLAGVGLNAVYAGGNSLLDYYGAARPTVVRAVSAVPGNGQATVTWIRPVTDGGAPITGYVVTPFLGVFSQGARAFPSSSTSALITGLTNGKSYNFRVTAMNPIGASLVSLASTPVTIGAPSAPLSPLAIPGKNQVTLKWNAPATNNGFPIVGYNATPYLAGKAQGLHVYNGAARSQIIKGLQNGKSYTFRVVARNVTGISPQSVSSKAVIVAGAPAPPSGVQATRIIAGRLLVTFNRGSGNGLPIKNFSATCTSPNGGVTRSATALASPIRVSGLTVGGKYRCRVIATNGRGPGLASGASNAVNA